MTPSTSGLGKASGWYWPTYDSHVPALSLVIPAFNEQDRLPRLTDGLRKACDLSTQIIVVDDGSQDNTAQVAEEGLADFTNRLVLRSEQNRGKGFALRRGIAAATAPQVVFMDADMATDLADVATVLRSLAHADLVAGSRMALGAEVEGSPLYRRVMRASFNKLVQVATATSVTDTQCGFKAFHTPVARLLFELATYDGFGLDLEVLDLAARLGFSVQEVPVRWEAVPGSKVRPAVDSVVLAASAVRLGIARPSVTLPVLSYALNQRDPASLATAIAAEVSMMEAVLATDRYVHVLGPRGTGRKLDPTKAAIAAAGIGDAHMGSTTTTELISAFKP